MSVSLDIIFLNLSYVFIVVALLVRDILKLRTFLVASQASFVAYALLTDNFSMTIWNSVFILVNVVQVGRLLMERRPVQLPDDLDDLYRNVFSVMSGREFLYFWETGKIRAAKDVYLICQGASQTELSLVIDGACRVIQDGAEIARLRRGHFIAEMSFLTEEPASADVLAEGDVNIISWDQDKLYALKQVQPDLMIKLQAILGKDLTRKLKSLSREKVARKRR